MNRANQRKENRGKGERGKPVDAAGQINSQTDE